MEVAVGTPTSSGIAELPSPWDAGGLDAMHLVQKLGWTVVGVAIADSEDPLSAPDQVADRAPVLHRGSDFGLVQLSEIVGELAHASHIAWCGGALVGDETEIVGVERAPNMSGDQVELPRPPEGLKAVVASHHADIDGLGLAGNVAEGIEREQHLGRAVGAAVVPEWIRRCRVDNQIDRLVATPTTDANWLAIANALFRRLPLTIGVVDSESRELLQLSVGEERVKQLFELGRFHGP